MEQIRNKSLLDIKGLFEDIKKQFYTLEIKTI